MRKLPLSALLLWLMLVLPTLSQAQTASAPAADSTYIYRLSLNPAYQTEATWDEKVNAVIDVHFKHLQDLYARGVATFIGRTTVALDSPDLIGLVVFHAPNMAAAKALAESDPAVVGGIMRVTVLPFSVVLDD